MARVLLRLWAIFQRWGLDGYEENYLKLASLVSGISNNAPIIIGASIMLSFGFVASYVIGFGFNIYSGMTTSDYLLFAMRIGFVFLIILSFICVSQGFFKAASNILKSGEVFSVLKLVISILVVIFCVYFGFDFDVDKGVLPNEPFEWRWSEIVMLLVFISSVTYLFGILEDVIEDDVDGIFILYGVFCFVILVAGFVFGKISADSIKVAKICEIHLDDDFVMNGRFVSENSTYNFFIVNDELRKVVTQKIKFTSCPVY